MAKFDKNLSVISRIPIYCKISHLLDYAPATATPMVSYISDWTNKQLFRAFF